MEKKPYTIVVATDYSPAAEAALRAAYDQAVKHAPAELHVVRVSLAGGVEAARPAPQYGGLGVMPILSLEEQKVALVQHLESVIPQLTGFRESEVRCFAHVVIDAPIFGITALAAALPADLVVIGAHGRHGITRWLLGSVASGVVRQATCPVLVVPPRLEQGPDAARAPEPQPLRPDFAITAEILPMEQPAR